MEAKAALIFMRQQLGARKTAGDKLTVLVGPERDYASSRLHGSYARKNRALRMTAA